MEKHWRYIDEERDRGGGETTKCKRKQNKCKIYSYVRFRLLIYLFAYH